MLALPQVSGFKERKMKVIIGAICLLAVSASFAGTCDYTWQTAADGSRCGGRAADVRSGGK